MKDIRGLVWNGSYLERASRSTSASADDVLRARASDAPPHIKAYMDAQRRARGLEPLWGGKAMSVADALAVVKSFRTASPRARAAAPASRGRTAAPTRQASTAPAAPAAKVPASRATPAPRATQKPVSSRTKRPASPAPDGAYWFAGVVSPGTSEAIPVGRDRVVARERIEWRAFADSVSDINAGRLDVALTDGHDGPVLASTRDGTLAVEVKPMVGLVISARVACAYREGILHDVVSGKAGLSCAFTPRRTSFVEDAQGRSVRVVHDAALDHVALIRPGMGRAAYRSEVVAVDARTDNAERVARSRAITRGMAVGLREVVAGN